MLCSTVTLFLQLLNFDKNLKDDRLPYDYGDYMMFFWTKKYISE